MGQVGGGEGGTSLVVQWLRFNPFCGGAWVQCLVEELRSHMRCEIRTENVVMLHSLGIKISMNSYHL